MDPDRPSAPPAPKPPPGTLPYFTRDPAPLPPPEPTMKERWFGQVAPGSGRGILAIAILVVLAALLFVDPIVQFVRLIGEGFPEEQPIDITAGTIVFVLLVNTVILVLLPVLYIVVTHPNTRNAIVRSLRLHWTQRTPVLVLLGALVTFVMMFAAGALLAWLVKSGWVAEPETSSLLIDLQGELNWFLVVLIPLVAAVTEEIFFRGFLQPRLGIWITSLLFGVVHIAYGTWLQLVAPVLIGLLLGFLFLRTNSLWTPIAGHFTFNFVELAQLLLERDEGAVGFL